MLGGTFALVGLGEGIRKFLIELRALVIAVVGAVAVRGGVQRRQVILCGRIIQHPAGTECGGDGAIGDTVANIAERRVRIALGVDAERVLDPPALP